MIFSFTKSLILATPVGKLKLLNWYSKGAKVPKSHPCSAYASKTADCYPDDKLQRRAWQDLTPKEMRILSPVRSVSTNSPWPWSEALCWLRAALAEGVWAALGMAFPRISPNSARAAPSPAGIQHSSVHLLQHHPLRGEMGWHGMGQDGTGWDGMGWGRLQWDRMRWDGTRWDWVVWEGMGWGPTGNGL